MSEWDENEIGRLLRLKRYEHPPQEYFENFLHEFHRRQRDELLRQPLWRICLERAHNFIFRLSVPSLSSLTSYPAAVAAVLICAGVISLRIYQEPKTAGVSVRSRPPFAATANLEPEWTLASPVTTGVFGTQSLRHSRESGHTNARSHGTPPRYVLDSVPVSYEPGFRF
jgi:hypothetical protein